MASIVLAQSGDAPPAAEPGIIMPISQPSPLAPQPTQTDLPPVPTATPLPQKPSPTDFVISYWQNVSDGRYENAWMQLSPRFQQAAHRGDYNDYVSGYLQMKLCRIVVSNVNVMQEDNFSAIVVADLTYYTGSLCNSSEYDFEMWLVYDETASSWLFDRNLIK
jgi:hypothetical protein